MNPHLTEVQCNDLLLGTAELVVAQHAATCIHCAGQVERMKAAIGEFRLAAIDWSETAAAGPPPPTVRAPRWTARDWTMRLALGSALVVLLALLVWRRERPRSVVPARADSAAQIARDNQLLAAINSDVNEAVPTPMQPLSLDITATRQ